MIETVLNYALILELSLILNFALDGGCQNNSDDEYGQTEHKAGELT